MVRRSRLEDSSKTGYTFNGWYLEAGFENEIETIDTSLLQNYNLYAKFTINQYTMTFNTNGVAGAIFYKEMVKPKQSTNYLLLKRDYHGNWVKTKKE